MARILIALGGNALQRSGGRGTWEEARAQMRAVAPGLAEVAAAGHELVLTHGNGPQVGALLRQNELGALEIPAWPMDVLGAETQGQVGYLIQAELTPALRRVGVRRSVLTVVSRMEVDPADPAFRSPSKPVGRYYTEEEANRFRNEHGWVLREDRARGGWRRLVPSPRPIRWLEGHAVRTLLEAGLGLAWIPVVCGGGGVPVVRDESGALEGVEAVIDKDLAAALVGRELGLDTFAIVTDVPGAAVGFGSPHVEWLGTVSGERLRELLDRGEFGVGSMGPKVEAGLEFLRAGGRRFIICEGPTVAAALRGEAGTRVLLD